MNLLLIVGAANDIFIYNYAKWLKASMNVCIDVFEFYHSNQQGYGYEYFDNVISAKGCDIPKIRVFVDSCLLGGQLKKYLNNKMYDIIHCQWIVAPFVLQRNLKKHCKKLILTFWGGEFDKQKILYSNKLYRYNLNRLSKQVDCIINDYNGKMAILNNLPYYKGDFKAASLGSAPLEELYNLMQEESKTESKKKLNMPSDKQVVLIGYSGKAIHRQLPIIKELHKYPQLKEKIHILAPMTRGASKDFVLLVENELNELGFSYTLIKDRFLTDEEMARIRNATDVVLQFSEWDGFSRSIIECLCAKSILLYGDWLEYENYLTPSGFEGVAVSSVEDGIFTLSNVIANMFDYQEITQKNCENGRHQALWSYCIKDWVNAYTDLLK